MERGRGGGGGGVLGLIGSLLEGCNCYFEIKMKMKGNDVLELRCVDRGF